MDHPSLDETLAMLRINRTIVPFEFLSLFYRRREHLYTISKNTKDHVLKGTLKIILCEYRKSTSVQKLFQIGSKAVC